MQWNHEFISLLTIHKFSINLIREQKIIIIFLSIYCSDNSIKCLPCPQARSSSASFSLISRISLNICTSAFVMLESSTTSASSSGTKRLHIWGRRIRRRKIVYRSADSWIIKNYYNFFDRQILYGIVRINNFNYINYVSIT